MIPYLHKTHVQVKKITPDHVLIIYLWNWKTKEKWTVCSTYDFGTTITDHRGTILNWNGFAKKYRIGYETNIICEIKTTNLNKNLIKHNWSDYYDIKKIQRTATLLSQTINDFIHNSFIILRQNEKFPNIEGEHCWSYLTKLFFLN